MFIQNRVYKYNATKSEIRARITGSLTQSVRWKDENNFNVKRKGPFSLFNLEGNIDELESKNKLKVSVTTDYKYLVLYTIPLALTVYGLFRQFNHSEKSLFLILSGISLGIFIFLITSYRIDTLKKNLKETLNMV